MAIGGNTALGPSRHSDQLMGRGPLAYRDRPSSPLNTAACRSTSPMSTVETAGYVTTQSGRQHLEHVLESNSAGSMAPYLTLTVQWKLVDERGTVARSPEAEVGEQRGPPPLNLRPAAARPGERSSTTIGAS